MSTEIIEKTEEQIMEEIVTKSSTKAEELVSAKIQEKFKSLEDLTLKIKSLEETNDKITKELEETRMKGSKATDSKSMPEKDFFVIKNSLNGKDVDDNFAQILFKHKDSPDANANSVLTCNADVNITSYAKMAGQSHLFRKQLIESYKSTNGISVGNNFNTIALPKWLEVNDEVLLDNNIKFLSLLDIRPIPINNPNSQTEYIIPYIDFANPYDIKNGSFESLKKNGKNISIATSDYLKSRKIKMTLEKIQAHVMIELSAYENAQFEFGVSDLQQRIRESFLAGIMRQTASAVLGKKFSFTADNSTISLTELDSTLPSLVKGLVDAGRFIEVDDVTNKQISITNLTNVFEKMLMDSFTENTVLITGKKFIKSITVENGVANNDLIRYQELDQFFEYNDATGELYLKHIFAGRKIRVILVDDENPMFEYDNTQNKALAIVADFSKTYSLYMSQRYNITFNHPFPQEESGLVQGIFSTVIGGALKNNCKYAMALIAKKP
jgi:hypothetical protein